MATHIEGQAANHEGAGLHWRKRLEAMVSKRSGMLDHGVRLTGLVRLVGLVTSVCSAIIWLGAAVTGQSSMLGMLLMTLLFIGSVCAALGLWFSLGRRG